MRRALSSGAKCRKKLRAKCRKKLIGLSLSDLSMIDLIDRFCLDSTDSTASSIFCDEVMRYIVPNTFAGRNMK
jgi:hypothetical protein